MKQLFCLLLTLFGTIAYGQIKMNQDFLKFAIIQDSLFIDAYKRHDVKSFNMQLTAFEAKYNALSETEKKPFSGNLTNAYYNLCCTYALVDNNKMALAFLKKSIAAGYFDYTHIMADADLIKLRNLKEFKVVVNPLRRIGDFVYILKNAEKYNANDNRVIPPFSYQTVDNPNLVALRKAFNLDSITGNANEVSRIINLMHWVHDLIPHEGNNGNPVVKNALSMIMECKRDHRGLNCRGMATVLNECLLSMGFKSRFITCLPKDSLKIDNDCHVINMVYAPSMKKWLWIDPTFNAYVMNEKGDLLSIEEVRERMIDDKPLILNPDANWNRHQSQTKEEYLYHYMAKNLYILECPVNSEYNLETKEPGKVASYIRLVPLDYFDQSPDKFELGTTIVKYNTNNSASFWQKP
jgi:hypothetical protein